MAQRGIPAAKRRPALVAAPLAIVFIFAVADLADAMPMPVVREEPGGSLAAFIETNRSIIFAAAGHIVLASGENGEAVAILADLASRPAGELAAIVGPALAASPSVPSSPPSQPAGNDPDAPPPDTIHPDWATLGTSLASVFSLLHEDNPPSALDWRLTTDTGDVPVAQGDWEVTHPMLRPATDAVACLQDSGRCLLHGDADVGGKMEKLWDAVESVGRDSSLQDDVEAYRSYVEGALFGDGPKGNPALISLTTHQVGTVTALNRYDRFCYGPAGACFWEDPQAKHVSKTDDIAIACTLAALAAGFTLQVWAVVAVGVACGVMLAYSMYEDAQAEGLAPFCANLEYQNVWSLDFTWDSTAFGRSVGSVRARPSGRDDAKESESTAVNNCWRTDQDRTNADLARRRHARDVLDEWRSGHDAHDASGEVLIGTNVGTVFVPLLLVAGHGTASIRPSDGRVTMEFLSRNARVCPAPSLGLSTALCVGGFELHGIFDSDVERTEASGATHQLD